jgi:hypothetical protein
MEIGFYAMIRGLRRNKDHQEKKTKEDTLKGTKEPKDCGGSFVLIGTLPHWVAWARATGNETLVDSRDEFILRAGISKSF